ncbi:MAG: hypothetical protein GXY48_07860 [Methanomicrobiales archaeon]|nr:hypothetical protein [Methanomicrobiales archaeon]
MKPFTRIKKIKGNEYLYEITPYLDESTGKWKQKSRYLGKNVAGEPVRRASIPKTGQVYDLGQYIPIYWVIREYKFLEALLCSFSPEEVALLLIVATNRITLPCSPRHMQTWFSGTWLKKLIPGAEPDPASVFNLLSVVSNRSVIGLFSRMISMINDFSENRIIMSGRITDFSQFEKTRGSGYPFKDLLEGDLGIRMFYDPGPGILTGCEITDIRRNFIDESLSIISSGRVPGSSLLPNWDYFSPVLIQNLVTMGYPFIIRPDSNYEPVSREILEWDENKSPGIECIYDGEHCILKDFIAMVGYTPVRGYILHHPKKELAIRHVFEKNLQNIHDMILQAENDPDTLDDLIREVAGVQNEFFIRKPQKSGVIRNKEMITREIRRLSRSCVLYLGDFSYQDCFSLTDTRWKIERDLFSLYKEFKRDLSGHQIERIKIGILFICFLSVMIKGLIMKRIEQAKFDDITSIDALMAELIHIRVVKSYQPVIVPAKLTRRQKTILSYFGGLPSV